MRRLIVALTIVVSVAVSASSCTILPPPNPCTTTITTASSIGAAEGAMSPGQTLCLSQGTYTNQSVSLYTSGTQAAPITVQSYPGEVATVDGGGVAGGAQADLVHLWGNYITLTGVVVQNYSGRAVVATGMGDLLDNNTIHNIAFNGILFGGLNDIASNNEIYATVLSNAHDSFGGSGWAEAVNTWYATPSTSGAVFTGNRIHDNWGEGIDLINTIGATVSGNTLSDNFSVLLYISGTSNVTVGQNTFSDSATDTTFYRFGIPSDGILMSNESGSCVDSVSITNNVLTHTSPAGVVFSTWGCTPTNVTTSGNTINP
jgi:parallel beta-helix repeat protein